MTGAFVLVVLAILLGLWLAMKIGPPVPPGKPVPPVKRRDVSGWVYFAAGEGTAVKIGMTQYEPTSQRLPELSSMSPVPLKLYFKQWVPDRFAAEVNIHDELKDSRLHGEWFDRDVALYYAAHLRGEL